jgi:hypothetical protein
MIFTEFCCRNGGNNLNAGSVDGGSTEPATTPLVTYTGGDWNPTTDVYTAPAGADMTQAVVGRFASVYHDGDANPTNNQYLVGRISVVDAPNRNITVHATARSLMGTEVAAGTGTRSMRIGGAWKGPNGAFQFPFNVINGTALTNVAGNTLRVNLKNDASFVISAAISHQVAGPTFFQGYTTTYGDLGKAIIDGGTTGASYILFSASGNGADRTTILDIIFQNNGATGTAAGATFGDFRVTAMRCVVRFVRGTGFENSSHLVECETYGCNQNGGAAAGGISLVAAGMAQRCISHHNTGVNGNGFYMQGSGALLLDCISANNGGNGLLTNNITSIKAVNCDFYANGVDGWRNLTANIMARIENCNFISNSGYGINISTGTARGWLMNCGFGSNTTGVKNNADALDEMDTVTYPVGQTPWVAPTTGDFTINHENAKGAGRGKFTQEYTTTWSTRNTLGKRDLGAAQHEDTGGGGGGGGNYGVVGS